MKKIPKPNLLVRVIIAIILGIICSIFFPLWATRIFATINGIFGNFLNFIIPLIIIGLVAPGIAELGKGAGKLLGITAAIAYGSTLFSGFFSYFTCTFSFPLILDPNSGINPITITDDTGIKPFFTIDMPPLMDVMSALLLAFILGIGLASVKGGTFKTALSEFREVVIKLITKIVIPLLPLFIFGIFLKIGVEGQVAGIMAVLFKIIIVIFIMHVVLLLIQYMIAGVISGKNPFKMLRTMMPAYMTALGTQSSAATIPVTLQQTIKNGVNEEVAGFVIPLCATIHLAGSILKIVACAMAIMWMAGMPTGFGLYAGFIAMLGITMVAAPGVPGGAIMAALGLLQSMLGFDETYQALMIALYVTMDSFGTACNVTGDGAIAAIMNKIYEKQSK